MMALTPSARGPISDLRGAAAASSSWLQVAALILRSTRSDTVEVVDLLQLWGPRTPDVAGEHEPVLPRHPHDHRARREGGPRSTDSPRRERRVLLGAAATRRRRVESQRNPPLRRGRHHRRDAAARPRSRSSALEKAAGTSTPFVARVWTSSEGITYEYSGHKDTVIGWEGSSDRRPSHLATAGLGARPRTKRTSDPPAPTLLDLCSTSGLTARCIPSSATPSTILPPNLSLQLEESYSLHPIFSPPG